MTLDDPVLLVLERSGLEVVFVELESNYGREVVEVQ